MSLRPGAGESPRGRARRRRPRPGLGARDHGHRPFHVETAGPDTEVAARMADQARDDGWSFEDYLAAVREREVSARNASGAEYLES